MRAVYIGAATMPQMTNRLSHGTQKAKRDGSNWQLLDTDNTRHAVMLTIMARPNKQSKILPLRKSRR
jgi:hypothetical protein